MMKLNPYTYGERGTVMYTGEGVVLPIQSKGVPLPIQGKTISKS